MDPHVPESGEHVKPRRPERPRSGGFVVPYAPRPPLIKPGIYEAVSTRLTLRHMRGGRGYIEALFTVFQGPFLDGDVLATGVPGYFNVAKGGVRAGSRFARWGQLLDPRAQHLHSTDFEDKAWRVLVDTVTHGVGGRTANGATDQEERTIELNARNQYSKVVDVLERLA